MAYFDHRFLEFFESLSLDNSKAFFDRSRKVYGDAVKRPFAELVSEMVARIAEHEIDLSQEPSDAIFRINRDLRFSRDKSPYKTHVGAMISSRGRKELGWPGFYIQLSHEGVMVAGGAYMPDREMVQRIRSRIAMDPETFADVIGRPAFKAVYGGIQGERLKRVPREFQETYEEQPLVANKQWYFVAEEDPETILRDDLADRLMGKYVAGFEVSEYLRAAIRGGPWG